MDNALEAVEVRLGGGDAILFVVRCATELPVEETVGSAGPSFTVMVQIGQCPFWLSVFDTTIKSVKSRQKTHRSADHPQLSSREKLTQDHLTL